MNNLKGKKCCVTGRNGFIGSALIKRLLKEGAIVYSYPREDLDYFFHFGSPSSNILFDKALEYCWNETLAGFINAYEFCEKNDVKLIYPSSATIYNLNTTYAQCKSVLEKIQTENSYKNILALRIFAGYGPGEKHKGDYASILYQFCKEMKSGKRPVIFGDGNQSRDFVYISDIIENIIANLDKTGFIDIGTGENTSFNEIVSLINKNLKTNLVPKYVDKPVDYIQDTVCKKPSPFKYSIEKGIKEILKTL